MLDFRGLRKQRLHTNPANQRLTDLPYEQPLDPLERPYLNALTQITWVSVISEIFIFAFAQNFSSCSNAFLK